jgi:hypothetical protein
MNKNKKINRSIIITFLVISQIYFSAVIGGDFKNEGNKVLTTNEIYLLKSFVLYNSAVNINNKTSGSEKVLTLQKLLNDKFYTIVLELQEKQELLVYAKSEENSCHIPNTILRKTNPRSPPLI